MSCEHHHDPKHAHVPCDHHDHAHHHEDGCGCAHGHVHHHEYHHSDACGCGHAEAVAIDPASLSAHGIHCGRCDAPMDECTCPPRPTTTKLYQINGLDCADCAAKVERGLEQIEGLEAVQVAYPAGLVRVTAHDPDRYLPAMSQLAGKLEPGCEIVARDRSVAAARAKASEAKETGVAEWFFGEGYAKLQLFLGGICFIAGLLFEKVLGAGMPVWLSLYLVSYAIIGLPIVAVAVRMLLNGQFFDEHFLMAVATIGAFAIAEWPEAVGVMLFYRIGEYFEDRASDRSRDQIMAAADLRPEVVNRVAADGSVSVIPSEDAQSGDLVVVRPGDRIPLDGIITEGTSRIDTSPVTGEPVPVAVAPGNDVVSGCVNTAGTLTLRVTAPLEASMVTKILDSVENAAATKPRMDRFITRFSRYYTPFVVAAAVAAALIPPLFFGASWHQWIYTAMSFLVISCPCALVLSVPLSYFAGIGAGSKRGILFKGGLSLEALNKVRAVVMDKTGTITEGNFTVQQIDARGNYDESGLLAVACALEARSSHPIAVSIVDAAKARGLSPAAAENVREEAGQGIIAEIAGKPFLAGNDKLLAAQGVALPEDAVPAYGTPVYLAEAGQFIGAVVIADAVKADAAGAVATLKQTGIRTVMLTGDRAENAEAVARTTGIDAVRAGLLPEDKLAALREIRQDKGGVMFVGDGINDAPVLAGADVGAAMGSGADAAIEAADVVFMNAELASVPAAIAIAKQTNRVAWANIVFALAVKAIVMLAGLLGHANMWVAVFADTGVSVLCVLNAIRILYRRRGSGRQVAAKAEALETAEV
ncbi:heavy metal translocating P-type ATPase [Pseudoramibacter faecis]|uniref:heavy metal translocating P-type ATPase n=1 Tax=Pseudoramibacter faecis TaxID=3108534 RepID=UPI002E79FDB8|nr:heavy metal translocating P-type ATPase [Pseudoramibacter sp. HA2172]